MPIELDFLLNYKYAELAFSTMSKVTISWIPKVETGAGLLKACTII